MAYSEELEQRIRDHIGDHPAVTDRKMFGGVAFMLQGNMAVGIHKDSLMVRIPPDEHEETLKEPGVGEFDMTGKVMRGWIVVGPEGIANAADLGSWIDRGLDFAGTLPAK